MADLSVGTVSQGDEDHPRGSSLVNAHQAYAVAGAPLRPHDPSITLEEYMFWAAFTREEEKLTNEEHRRNKSPTTIKSLKDRLFSGKKVTTASPLVPSGGLEEKKIEGAKLPTTERSLVVEAEWKTAGRALRTAGWGSVFYLITTDVLGPFTTPWAFAQMGFGPGFALYTVFGVASWYSGWILWKVFLGVDSDRYPVKGYGDLFFRLLGPWARHLTNIGQAIQLLMFLSILTLVNGQSISQMSQGPDGGAGICFVTCLIIFMAAGYVLGQVRTLQKFGFFANFAVWLNLLSIFIIMGVVANSPPNFQAIINTFGDQWQPGPIITYAGTPPDGMATGGSGFIGSLNGLNQAVYSYGGAMLFAAFLAEMRHPLDFWKGLLYAELFIYTVYVVFGMYCYHFYGQFSYNPIYQGVSPYQWQTTLNAFNLVTGLIAAALYGNIGLKVVYIEVFEEVFHFPGLTTHMGKIWWAIMIPLYWSLAFIIAAAVPQFSFVSGFIGALWILSFTYTFPALLAVVYWIKKDGIVEGKERFDPATRSYNYIDGGTKRLWRGFMKKPLFNIANILYFLGALATCALGCYTSVTALIGAFQSGVATSFTCSSPV